MDRHMTHGALHEDMRSDLRPHRERLFDRPAVEPGPLLPRSSDSPTSRPHPSLGFDRQVQPSKLRSRSTTSSVPLSA